MFGAYEYQNKLEDVSILLNIFHFTKLKELNTFWYNRSFITANITKQFYPVLDQPLMLQSGTYGLSYFGNYHTYGDFRAILKYETYFFNMRKNLKHWAPSASSSVTILHSQACWKAFLSWISPGRFFWATLLLFFSWIIPSKSQVITAGYICSNALHFDNLPPAKPSEDLITPPWWCSRAWSLWWSLNLNISKVYPFDDLWPWTFL